MTSYFYGGRSLLIMADNGQVAGLSIQARAEPKTVNEQVYPSTFWFSSQTEEEISPWWSEQRDIDLRNFVKKDGNDILVGAISSLLKKFKSMNWLLEGRSSRTKRIPKKGTVEFYQPVLANADLGKGWSVLLSKTIEDYLTQDKGAFWELIGEGEPDSMLEGAVLGIAHLDAAQCAPTGDIVYPVLYRNPKKGTTHKLHTSRVVRLTDMPSSVEGMMDIGFCSVSRVIASSMVLLKLARYKNEKLSDLPEAGLLILNNIMRHQWEDAEASFQRERRRMGQDFWVNIMTFFGVDPAQQASATFTNFSSLPDAFNELESTNIYVNVVALCFGVDVREFWPLTGGQLGTASESEVQHKKARGKGIGELIGLIERAINWRVLPKTVSFKFDFRDDEEDALRASIAKVRTDTIMSMWQPPRGEGEESPVSSDEIRQMLAEAVPYFKDEFLSTDLTENVELTDIDRQDI